ncbi:MAG: methionine synthase [Oscillospiraceae bacterium]
MNILEITSLNKDEALRYMGWQGKCYDPKVLNLMNECEDIMLKNIKPRYTYRVFEITHKDNEVAVEGTSLVLKGNDICEHLQNCERCILLCATISSDVDKLIRSYEATDMAKAMACDCLGSAAIEQVCDKAEIDIKNAVGDFNFTWRFSPGYGDFPLDIQNDFLSVLDARKRVGVDTTESMIMIPRKSVTAVIGISKSEISQKHRGCVSCKMRDKCQLRLRGEHCGV